jgi:hypothetical protein
MHTDNSNGDLLTLSSVFWDITPCKALRVRIEEKTKQETSMKQAGLLTAYFMLISCLASLQPWRWNKLFLWMSVDFQWTAQHYNLEDVTPHKHCCKNLKAYNLPNLLHITWSFHHWVTPVTMRVGPHSLHHYYTLKVTKLTVLL